MKSQFINKIGLLSIVLYILVSCSKKEKHELNDIGFHEVPAGMGGGWGSEPEGILAYYDFITQGTNGFFGIKSYVSVPEQDTVRATFIGGHFFDTSRTTINGGTVKFKNYTLTASSSPSYTYGLSSNQGEDLFGQKIALEANPDHNNNSTYKIQDSLYIPELISLAAPENNTTIEEGTDIKWNTDLNNEVGILLILQYDPDQIDNGSFSSTYRDPIVKAVTTIDDGLYTLTREDLSDFPDGAKVSLIVLRVNYKTIQKSGQPVTCGVYAYTAVEGFFVVAN